MKPRLGKWKRKKVVTDSSSDSPLLRSSRSSRPRTVYLDKERSLEREGGLSRAISLGEGLHRLAGRDDGPDGEIPLEQQSFLHSKYASSMSTFNLAAPETAPSSSEESVRKRRGKERRKKGDKISSLEAGGNCPTNQEPFFSLVETLVDIGSRTNRGNCRDSFGAGSA